MTVVRDHLLQELWKGRNPFEERSMFRGRVDFQGWSSQNPFLSRAIDEVRPSVVVEIGVWKGGSVITMAERMKALKLDGAIVAVDTWLGAWDHWLQPEWFEHLRIEAGYPTLFRTFCANIIERDLVDYVVPLTLDSVNAATLLKLKNISPNVIHIDGGHDFDAVMSDLRLWWPMLLEGGVLIGDDYHPSGGMWPAVKDAFHTFFGVNYLEHESGKCWIRKAAAAPAG